MVEIIVPCLVSDKTGWTPARLEIGNDSSGDPVLMCNEVSCLVRTRFLNGIIGAAYQPMPVKLDSTEGVSKVVYCRGGGVVKVEPL